jgi:NAD(P)-dependent dehydrogenase (short-subunit alcohol dehydrogenase family)
MMRSNGTERELFFCAASVYSVVSMKTPLAFVSRLNKRPLRKGGRVALYTGRADRRGRIIVDVLLNTWGNNADPLEKWNHGIGANLPRPFFCSKPAAPYLHKDNGARGNIASPRAQQSEANTEAYSVSKNRIVAMPPEPAGRLESDIRVNRLGSAWIKSDPEAVHAQTDKARHPGGRGGASDDISTLTAYLLSGHAGFIPGQDFAVDGGMTK